MRPPVIAYVRGCEAWPEEFECWAEEHTCDLHPVMLVPLYEEEADEPDVHIELKTGDASSTLPWSYRSFSSPVAHVVRTSLQVYPRFP